MKMFRKKEDGVVDNLLRAYVGRQSGASQVCQDFDPDLANAYIERRLTTTETARYEFHLSECSACRKNVIALARMVELDAASPLAQAAGSVKRVESNWLTALTSGALPQWALAATAVVILVAGVSLLVMRGERSAYQTTPAGDVAQQGLKSQEAIEQDKSNPRKNEAIAAQSASASRGRAAPEQEIARDKQVASSREQTEQSEPAKDSRAANSQPPQTQAVEAGSAASRAAESDTASAAESKIATQPQASAPAPAGGEQKIFPHIDPAQALRLPQEDEKSTQVSVLKPGTGGTEPKTGKEEVTTIRPQDNIAPPPASSTADSRSRRLAQPPPGLALRNSNSDEAAPAPGATPRKIKSKRFWLLKGVWTDNDYKPYRELPEVTLVRDSEVYNEVLTKRSGLKPYFTGFDKSERAVIVYKGTVYKLIPQEASK